MTHIAGKRVLSLFTGAMGLDLGLERHGFKTVLAIEYDKHARATIKTNRPDVMVMDDVFSVTPADMIASRGPFDVICGGPPCQSWSYAGNRKGMEDQRGLCIPRFLDIVEAILPNTVIMENVLGLTTASIDGVKGAVINLVTDRLTSFGYKVSSSIVNSADFGSPQCRKRIVFIATMDGRLIDLQQTHSQEWMNDLPKWRTLRDSISDVPPSQCAKYPKSQFQYITLLKEGQNWRNLPVELQKEAMGGAFEGEGGRTSYFRRLSWGKPAPTLVCCPTQKSTCLCHPDEDRPLNVKEYARIQGFPDDWVFCGPLAAQYKQIGNAVPVQLAEAIGKAIS